MKQLNNNLVFNITPGAHTGLETYRKQGGYESLQSVISKGADFGLNEVRQSGLLGRGGAAFPTGNKIEMVRNASGHAKYIICNADEGEPGTFKDRFIMTHIPFQLIEGITIAAYLAGASKGIIYVRHEYPEAQHVLRESLTKAEQAGLLGANIFGSRFSLNIEIFSGAGSYLCGEETALLSSIEGKKGRPRLKPPFPTQNGLFGMPTLINNVETLTNIPKIILHGAEWYRGLGLRDSAGTKLISLSGDVEKRGLFEVPFGTTFEQIIYAYGGGINGNRALKAVNIGGASGVLVPPSLLGTQLEWQACAQAGVTIGSGAVFVLDETRSILKNVQNRVRFFLHESCGKCTPCREGLHQSGLLLDQFFSGRAKPEDIGTLERYGSAMQSASFCGLGTAAGNSIMSSLAYYRDEYEACCITNINEEVAI